MGAYRGNVDKVMADAEIIVRRLKDGGATVKGVGREYHCSWQTVYRAISSQMSRRQWKELCRKKILQNNLATRFRTGDTPWNKGKKGIHMSPATEFKKGRVSLNLRPVGTVTLRRDKGGREFRWIKIGDNRRPGDWTPYARFLWQQTNGPVPAEHLVVHVDGDTLNDDPANLRLVDRKEHVNLQRKKYPEMERKRRIASARAARRRHARNRKEKEQERKERERERRQMEKESQEEKQVEAAKEALRGSTVSWWECIGCGYEFDAEPTGICPKCNGYRFERINQRCVA